MVSDSLKLLAILACIAIVFIDYRRRHKKPVPDASYKAEKTPVTSEKIYAVDFTSPAPRAPKKVFKASGPKSTSALPSFESKTIIFYSTLTGSSKKVAEQVLTRMSTVLSEKPILQNLDYVDDLDEYFLSPSKYKDYIYLFVVPSYETESPLDFFIESLKETYNDFRVDSRPLHKLGGFTVFGLGDSESWGEESKFCYQAKQIDRLMGKLGCPRICPLGTGCVKTSLQTDLDEYLGLLTEELRHPSEHPPADIVDSDDEDDSNTIEEVMDVEDLGKAMNRSSKKDKTGNKAMVAKDSPTFKALTKQGYTVVGSHSGVKICRWTKSALRGRGSCYKYAFYGIRSHLCMETTPSLSCSNKCVFCWRHGTNPVGTTWRWQVDSPQDILNGALEGHYKKIKQMKGVPGVQAARFAEAFTVRHCALSLVGEPIFYPHIDEFLSMLHAKHISSFLVCNAQHPKELDALKRVTQLYVSIDAADKDTLKKVDRPLHRDFWERMMECLDIIRKKTNQRTVYRLTLVKGFNADEVEGYADLVERGMPAFIEVKGVTFCGNSATQQLTMNNVPYYDEVKMFVEALNDELQNRGLDYGIATEHAHSCCILLAQKRFYIDDKWYTHIDYDRFFELLESGKDFGPMDYIAETPSFAYYGSKEAGFNPEDVPHRRGKPVNLD